MNDYVVDKHDAHRKVGDILEERGDKEGQNVIIIEVPSEKSEFFLLQRLSNGERFWVGALTLFDSYKHIQLTELSKALVDAQYQAYTVLQRSEQFASNATDMLNQARESCKISNSAVAYLLLDKLTKGEVQCLDA